MPINEYDALIDESPAPQPVPDVNPDAPNEYDALIDTSPLFQVMTSAGLETDAGRAAKILHLQDRTRLPSAFISDNFDTVASEAQRLDFDPDKFRDSPAVKEWLSQKPEYASIVAGHPGELDRLVQMEQVIRADPKLRYRGKDFISRESADGAFAEDLSIQDFYKDYNLRAARGEIDASERRSNADELKKTYGPAHQIIAGVYQSWASTLSAVQTGPVDPSKFQPAADVTQASVDLDPSFTGTLLRGAGGLVGDVPLMLVGGPLAQGAETIGLFARLGKTAKAIGQTAVAVQPLAAREGVNTAREHGAWNGLAAWGIETVIPASFGKTGIERAIIGNLTREGSDQLRTGAALWLKQAGLEATEETVTEFAHAIHEAASGMDPDALSWNKLAPRLAAAGILGGVAGGVFNAPEALASIKEPGMPADRIDRQSVLNASVATVDQAKSYADRLRALGQMVGESQTNAAHGPSFDQLVEQAGGSNETLHFDPAQWNEYFQSKQLDPRVMAQAVLADADLYEESQATGATLQIPLGKYLSVLAIEHNDGLSAIAKADPSLPSEGEAIQSFRGLTNLTNEQLETLKNQAREVAQSEAGAAVDPGADIAETITTQLLDAGIERSQAETQAKAFSAGFVAIANNFNKGAAEAGRPLVTPQQIFAKNFDRIQRSIPGLTTQGDVTVADTILDRLRAGDLPNEDTIYGPSLFEFLGKRGGVQDQGTELSSMAVDANRSPFQKKLIRKDGMTLDRAAEAAHEAGYIPSADINVLLEAINREASGEKVRIAGDIANEAQDAIRLQMLEWQEFLGNQGINLQDTSNEEIKALFYAPPEEQGGQEFAQTEPDAAPMADTIDIDGVQRSTLNSEGKRIGANEEQVRNFWAWFGDSKVVDAGGRPRVVYHGTNAEFDVFRPSRAQGLGKGVYFTTDRRDTAEFGANVIEAYVALINPYTEGSRLPDSVDEDRFTEDGNYANDVIREAGFDGIIARQWYGSNVDRGDEILAFDPTQIKSATGNRGTFDPSNPNILFQSSPAAAPDTAHLSPDAQAYVASLTPEQQQTLASTIAYLKMHPDPKGDVGNLQMVLQIPVRSGKAYNQAAYHGSPHRFDKFTTDHMGSGEGAQVYGWGLYFAGSKDIGKYYKDTLGQEAYQYDGKAISPDSVKLTAAQLLMGNQGDKAQTIDDLQAGGPGGRWGDSGFSTTQVVAAVRKMDYAKLERGGRLYTVNIPEDGDFLLWDKPLSEQPQKVRDALADIGEKTERSFPGLMGSDPRGQGIYDAMVSHRGGSPETASKWLLENGIKGIKYLDGNSRSDGEGSFNYVIFDGADVAIQEYEQRVESTKQGSILFSDTPNNRRALINLFETANASTFIHETGHLFLQVFTDLANRADAPAGFKKDLGTLLTWFGVESSDQIGVDQHEQFARGFEAYAREGKAPSNALAEVFYRFKGWLRYIYQTIRELNVELNDDVRGVMDRMLASEEAIADAQTRQGVISLPRSVFPTDQAYDAYLDSVSQSTEEAETALRVQLMKAEGQARSEVYREERKQVRAFVADDIDQKREMVALFALQNGTRPDGQSLPDDLRGLKLDRSELVETFGEDALGRLPGRTKRADKTVWRVTKADGTTVDAATKAEANDIAKLNPKSTVAREVIPGTKRTNPNNQGSNLYAAEGGMSLAQAANLFGFVDGATLWEALVNAPDRASLIEQQTNAVMRERFPDPLTDGTLEAKADAAMHGAHRSRLLLKEIQALSLRVGQTAAPIEVLRSVAREQIGKQEVRALRPDRYQIAERAAARDVEVAIANDAPEAALLAKQRELLNHEMYRAALKAKEAADATFAYFKSLGKTEARKRIGKAGGWAWTVQHPDGSTQVFDVEADAMAEAKRVPGSTWDQTSGYLDQIDGLMADYEFRRVSLKVLKRRQAFAAWAQSRVEAGEVVAIPEDVLTAKGKNWRLLTVSELEALSDAVKNIEHMARLKNQLLTAKKNAEYAAARDEVTAGIKANVTKRRQVKNKTERSFTDKAKMAWNGFLAAHTKVSTVALESDGGIEGGAFQRFLVDPVNAAGVVETQRMQAEAEVFQDLAIKHRKAGRNLKERVEITSLGTTMKLEERIMWALNWGNRGNRDRLLKGESMARKTEITEAHGQEVIDSLEQADWDFINGLLHQINTFWPEIASLERRMTGIEPGKVYGDAFQTRLGVQPGGYFPIKYDRSRSPKNAKVSVADEVAYVVGSAASKSTSRGHTKERTGALGPLDISLDVAARHIAQVVHDLSYREALADVSKWLNDPEFRDTIFDYHGEAVLEQMEAWRGDMARRDLSENTADRFLRKMRSGVSLITLGFNVGSAAVQIAGIGPTMQRVGVLNFSRAVSRIFHDPERTESALAFVYSKSALMKDRGTTRIREVNEAVRGLRGQGWLGSVQQASYWMIGKAQIAVDLPTWMAAYEKSLAEGRDDAAAVAIADQVVRDTQGSGLASDLTGVQRSRYTQLFTVFFTPAAVTFASSKNAWASAKRAGLIAADASVAERTKAAMQLLMDFMTIYVIPAAITVGIKEALGAAVGGDDDDKESMAAKIRDETLAGLMNNLIGLRDLSGAIQGFSYSGPAGVRPLVDASRLVQQSMQLYDGDKGGFQSDQLDAALLKALINNVGTWTHLPVRPVTQIIDGLDWAEEHDKNPILPVLLGKPRK